MSDCCHHAPTRPTDWPGFQRSAVALVWAATFFVTAFGPWSSILVAPWQRVVLAIAGLVVVILALLRLIGPVRQAKTPSPLESCVHLLPLLMLLLIPPQDPGAEFVDRLGWGGGLRGIHATMPEIESHSLPFSPSLAPPPVVNQLSLSHQGSRVVLRGSVQPTLRPEDFDPNFPPINLLDAYRDPRQWQGRQIELLVTTAHLNPRRLRQLPPQAQALKPEVMGFRLVMICCIADAWPISVVLSGVQPTRVGESEWIRARGTVNFLRADSGPLMRLEVLDILPAQRPDWPFLSPL
ncbi:MAG: hypothetical protein EA402_05335 [Planctomycetota bacterium]|nr:MAG: hypothetical protein EA402_05335 [Planctomycetota bacterium]